MPPRFDAFLSYNLQDGPAVEEIARQLEARGIRSWLARRELKPGSRRWPAIEEQLRQVGAIVMFFGPHGIGPGQQDEIDAALQQRVERQCTIIPVILPESERLPEPPMPLRALTWVDFRIDDPDPMEQLVWGVTGVRTGVRKARLSRVDISGFKTIRELQDFGPRSMNVLIGPNGAGKSNFISFFRLLTRSLESSLQQYVGECGGASALLHGGSARTQELTATIELKSENLQYSYEFRLSHAAGDSLVFAEERYRAFRNDQSGKDHWTNLAAGNREARIVERARDGEKTARLIRTLLKKFVIYQFNDTSANSRVRQKWNENDSRWLKSDGANLGPFLFRLQNQEPRYYSRIVETLSLVLPFFSEFELDPEHGKLLLRWRERGSDVVYDASQAADGMLRVMALTSLLLQPEADLPSVLILDEPELGLHPYAINVLGGLIRSASTHVQVILATQSVALLDCFEPEDVVVVDRLGQESSFTRLNTIGLESWLEEYSLSELWEKNVLGGRPSS